MFILRFIATSIRLAAAFVTSIPASPNQLMSNAFVALNGNLLGLNAIVVFKGFNTHAFEFQ